MYGSPSTTPIQKEVMDDPKKAAIKRRLAAKPKSDNPAPVAQDPTAELIQKRKRGF